MISPQHPDPARRIAFDQLRLVVCFRVPVGSIGRQHGVDDPQQLVRGGDGRAFINAAHGEQLVVSAELAVVSSRGGVGAFDEDFAQVQVASAGVAVAAFAGALVVAGTVNGESQVIVGQHVSQAANDSQEVSPALDEVEEATGRVPEKLSLNNGYYSGKNLQEMSDRQVQAYVATDRGEKQGKGDLEESERHLVKADFRYDEQRDGFHCPGGQLLRVKTVRGTVHRAYQAEIEACRSCAYYRRCCRSKSGAARTITSDGKEPLRRAMNERMRQPESKAIYARRKTIVEPVFGQIKNSGFRGFGLRGKEKVAGEFSLVCTAHNLKKIIFAALRREVVQSSGSERPGRKKGEL